MDDMKNTSPKDLDDLIQQLRNQKARLAEKAEDIERRLEAALLTKGMLGLGEEPDKEDLLPAISKSELQGMTQLEAMVHIAKKNNGKLRTTHAVKLLLRSGLMKKTKNSYTIAYTVMKRSGKFKPSGNPGEYELIEEERAPSLRVMAG
jgi:hypothetical protein